MQSKSIKSSKSNAFLLLYFTLLPYVYTGNCLVNIGGFITMTDKRTFFELTSEVEALLKSLSYSNARISTYRKSWESLAKFMKQHSIEYYDSMVGETFIKNLLGTKAYEELRRREKDVIRCINVLTEYQITGTIKFRSVSKSYEFKGEMGQLILGYLTYRKSQGLSEDTLDGNRLYLHRFLDHLDAQKVSSLTDMDKRHVMDFINGLGFYSKATIHCMLSSLRGFLKYLYDNRFADTDFSYLLPKSSYKKEAQLPTTYTKDEVETLINAVDRTSPKGKRDVAMILLIADGEALSRLTSKKGSDPISELKR